MIGLVIVTHAPLGASLLEAVAMIVGPQPCAEALEVRRDLDPETLRGELAARIARVGAEGDGVVIMTDMFGGTPSNLAVPFLATGHVEVIGGVNLPMVLKFFANREGGELSGLIRRLRDYGQQGIVVAGELLQQRQENA